MYAVCAKNEQASFLLLAFILSQQSLFDLWSPS